MTYVRVYGPPYLLTTFTYNPQWNEIKKTITTRTETNWSPWPEEISTIISAEIPDPNVDPEFFDIVAWPMGFKKY